MKKQVLALLFLLPAFMLRAQETPANRTLSHSVYLIGNTAQFPKDAVLTSFSTFLSQTKEPFTLMHLGDLIGNSKDSLLNRQRIDKLLQLVKNAPNGSMYFVPGDKDWGNSRANGWKAVKALEKAVESAGGGKDIVLPSSGCPGPEVIDIGDDLRIIAINTQWWMHPYDKPVTTDNDCKCRTELEFLEELEEVLQDSEGKNVIIAGHHPVISYGNYGGRIPLKRHLFPFPETTAMKNVPAPVLGTFYAAYRQNVGTPRDMAYPAYERFISGIDKLLIKHNSLIYAASHEYNLQLNYMDGNYHVISGSFSKTEPVGRGEETKFSRSAYGFSKIEYYTDGSVFIRFYRVKKDKIEELWSKQLFQPACSLAELPGVPVNHNFPCESDTQQTAAVSIPKTITLPASNVYTAGPVKRLFFGSRYRKDWLQPVQMPVLDLRTAYGGLQAYGKGGGRQTLSLKFKAGDGKEYVFRSVDKDFTRTLVPELKRTIFEPVLRDVTSTQHPYGALAVSRMLDATDIMHARPQLVVLPDDPALGPFRKDFANMPGMIEDRPVDAGKNSAGFMGADKVVQSVSMFRKVFQDHDNRIAVENYGKARVFDILIGDWGRHQDNLKWAAYKQGDKTIYYPIPRDRDHSFSRWDGIVSKFVDRPTGLPFIENFDYRFHDVRSLTYNARHLDRMLLSSLDRSDWQQLSKYIESHITDAVIDSAILALPAEVRPISGDVIARKLKSRRALLSKATDDYYLMLAERVDVLGSNKQEYFDIHRLANGNVRVRMWALENGSVDSSSVPLYDREFVLGETREIDVYGLAGEDVFVVRGSSRRSILVRVIGGDDKDKITDTSLVTGFIKRTFIYDTEKTDLTLGKESRDLTSDRFDVNDYDRVAFKYNRILPLIGIYYRRDDGFGISAGVRFTTQGFRKDDYQARHEFRLTASTNYNLYATYESSWHHIIRKWDILTRAGAGHYFPNFSFYGFGDQTVKDSALYDAGFYRLFNQGVYAGAFLERRFFKYASFSIGPVFEMNDLGNKRIVLQVEPEPRSVLTSSTLAGIESSIDFDMRDRKDVATKGIRLSGDYATYYNTTVASHFSVAEAFLEYYGTFRVFVPVTLAAEVGGSKNYGEDIPLNKYVYLGQKHHLRGYVKHRFTGDATAYINTELRINIGKVNNNVIPFYYGVFGFKDYGKVWMNNEGGTWHGSEGAGVFIAPISSRFTFRLSAEHSEEEDLLLDIGAGFYIDK